MLQPRSHVDNRGRERKITEFDGREREITEIDGRSKSHRDLTRSTAEERAFDWNHRVTRALAHIDVFISRVRVWGCGTAPLFYGHYLSRPTVTPQRLPRMHLVSLRVQRPCARQAYVALLPGVSKYEY